MIDATKLTDLLALTSLIWFCGAGLLFALHFIPSTRNKVRPLFLLLISQAGIIACVFILAIVPRMGVFLVLALALLRITYEALSVARLDAKHSTSVLVLGLLAFPFLPFAGFSIVWLQDDWRPALVLIILLVEIFDSFSLLGGQLFGRRKLIPAISPNKTIEGLYCGILSLLVLGSVLVVDVRINFASALLVLIMVGLCAFAGDVAASVQKRAAGVKDYPTVLKIQGGLLDICDSWIVACPVIVAVLALLQIWGRH